jgi:hypothetical protein
MERALWRKIEKDGMGALIFYCELKFIDVEIEESEKEK